ncbi:hypothetical protein [Streptomyces sp. NPDC055681]
MTPTASPPEALKDLTPLADRRDLIPAANARTARGAFAHVSSPSPSTCSSSTPISAALGGAALNGGKGGIEGTLLAVALLG